ncbi:uncharacterized protein LOC120357802 [Solenopsis invicta]|uniref:uncharacterized protein LOC120357802 n=1 Tax=Solenopsis invicta TaxID=13686 RepID=UPI00193D90DC|nr:uncharacterized protein LOC120357802 [Solenopsis invicta]
MHQLPRKLDSITTRGMCCIDTVEQIPKNNLYLEKREGTFVQDQETKSEKIAIKESVIDNPANSKVNQSDKGELTPTPPVITDQENNRKGDVVDDLQQTSTAFSADIESVAPTDVSNTE